MNVHLLDQPMMPTYGSFVFAPIDGEEAGEMVKTAIAKKKLRHYITMPERLGKMAEMFGCEELTKLVALPAKPNDLAFMKLESGDVVLSVYPIPPEQGGFNGNGHTRPRGLMAIACYHFKPDEIEGISLFVRHRWLTLQKENKLEGSLTLDSFLHEVCDKAKQGND